MASWLLRGPSSAGAGQVLVVYYEDLLLDLPGQVARVDAFLHGRDDKSCGQAPPEYLDRVLKQVTFAYMKSNIDRYQPVSVGWKPGYQFIRKGTAGDYKALLTPEQVQRYRESLRASFPTDVLTFKPGFLEG